MIIFQFYDLFNHFPFYGHISVALNFQTPGAEMDLNDGRFLVNGHCGYVLKPAFLCNNQSNFDPKVPIHRSGQHPIALTIKV